MPQTPLWHNARPQHTEAGQSRPEPAGPPTRPRQVHGVTLTSCLEKAAQQDVGERA